MSEHDYTHNIGPRVSQRYRVCRRATFISKDSAVSYQSPTQYRMSNRILQSTKSCYVEGYSTPPHSTTNRQHLEGLTNYVEYALEGIECLIMKHQGSEPFSSEMSSNGPAILSTTDPARMVSSASRINVTNAIRPTIGLESIDILMLLLMLDRACRFDRRTIAYSPLKTRTPSAGRFHPQETISGIIEMTVPLRLLRFHRPYPPLIPIITIIKGRCSLITDLCLEFFIFFQQSAIQTLPIV